MGEGALIETETERNWADLLPELLSLILKKLSEISDFVRCRAVCKTWRLSSSISDLPPQFPWIVKASKGFDLEFYSIAFKKVYTIRAHCSSGNSLLGSTGSYMLKQYGNPESYSLLNPVTNSEVPLPALHVCNLTWLPWMFSWYYPPSFRSDDYVFLTEVERLVGCKPGDDRWNIIGPGRRSPYRCYHFKDLFFRVDSYNGFTKIMDIRSHRELYDVPAPKYKKIYEEPFRGPYLVESCGEILSVSHNQSIQEWRDIKFSIHCLKFGNGKTNPCWVELNSIGDQILFFEITEYFGRGFSLRASDFTGFKGNCIYFMNRLMPILLGYVHMYDIENSETILIDTPFAPFNMTNHITWFMPTLKLI